VKNWHKLAGLYLLAGAGVAGWAYFKGYAFSPMYLLTWPTKITTINAAPKTTPSTPRASLG
jgi:hypothetical protein